MPNTGNRIHPTLKKVTNDVNEYPLDIHNELCSVSGLPQDTKPNPTDSPSYIDPDVSCDPVTYYSAEHTEYFRKDCGDDLGDNIPYTVAENAFTSTISQEDADNKALEWLRINGQANAEEEGVCSTTTCNLEETRAFYSNSCEGGMYANPYYVTLPANTFCGTPDDVDADINTWFDENGQSQADLHGTCQTGDQDAIIYKTDGNPCTSDRTAIRIYYQASDNKWYMDSERTILANLHFFPTDSISRGFKQIIGGVIQEFSTEYTQCDVEGTLHYQDFGPPADISVYNDHMLACYPNNHIVVKYDLTTGTNPTGIIVAGELNKPCTGPAIPSDSMAYRLNTPMMVEWRKEDFGAGGNMFVVYSAGPFKSLKLFTGDGELYSIGSFGEEAPVDAEWQYNSPGEDGYYHTPTSTTSLVGLMTAQTANLSNFWLPVSLSYYKRNVDDDLEDVFIGLWNKSLYNANRFKIYSITFYPGAPKTHTICVRTDEGFTINSRADVIRSMTVIKSTATSSSTNKYNISIVTPYSPSKGNKNNRMRYYDLHFMTVEVAHNLSNPLNPPVVSYTSAAYYNSYKHNSKTSGIWKNNVKAEINILNDNLVVIIKSSSDSFWNILLRTTAVSTAGAVVGTVGAILLDGIALTWWTDLATIGVLGLTPGGILVGLLIVAAVVVFSPPPQRYIGTSNLGLNYTGDVITAINYYAGSYVAQTWINNNTSSPRTVHLNQSGITLDLYSLYSGRVVKIGDWDADNSTDDIVV